MQGNLTELDPTSDHKVDVYAHRSVGSWDRVTTVKQIGFFFQKDYNRKHAKDQTTSTIKCLTAMRYVTITMEFERLRFM